MGVKKKEKNYRGKEMAFACQALMVVVIRIPGTRSGIQKLDQTTNHYQIQECTSSEEFD